MAVKKFYAVKNGRTMGICLSWEECKASVEGFPNAQYKGFADKVEALRYLGLEEEAKAEGAGGQEGTKAEEAKEAEGARGQEAKGQEAAKEGNHGKAEETVAGKPPGAAKKGVMKSPKLYKNELPAPGALLAYVDGSYSDALKKYAFGCVFILPDEKIYLAFGNGNDPQSLQHRNVTGEMLGAMYAAKTAIKNGFKELEICFDYQGIEKWVTGEWKSKTELTRKYTEAMRKWTKDVHITFTKVEAHTNVRFNELADKTAKRGLTEGQGVPKVKMLEEMESYGDGDDSAE